MEKDFEKLDHIYSFLENNIAKYCLSCNLYYESDNEKQEGEKYLRQIEEKFNNAKGILDKFYFENKKVPFVYSYDENFASLNYLSFKFIKDYIEKYINDKKEEMEKIRLSLESEEIKNKIQEFFPILA